MQLIAGCVLQWMEYQRCTLEVAPKFSIIVSSASADMQEALARKGIFSYLLGAFAGVAGCHYKAYLE